MAQKLLSSVLLRLGTCAKRREALVSLLGDIDTMNLVLRYCGFCGSPSYQPAFGRGTVACRKCGGLAWTAHAVTREPAQARTDYEPCPYCGGTGYIRKPYTHSPGDAPARGSTDNDDLPPAA